MNIRKLSKKDAELVLNLELHSAPDKPLYARYDTSALTFIFDHPEKCAAFGAFEEEKLVGWSAYRTQWSEYNSQEDGIFEISSIVVDKNHRKQGIGKQLLEHIFS